MKNDVDFTPLQDITNTAYRCISIQEVCRLVGTDLPDVVMDKTRKHSLFSTTIINVTTAVTHGENYE